MVTTVKLDYEKVVSDYLQSLTTVLRGFNSGTGHGFLETWVYDEDESRSIIGIIEAARDAALPEISIYLGPATVKKLDLAALREQAAYQGRVTIQPEGEGLNLDVSFDKEPTGAAPAQTKIAPLKEAPVTRAAAPAVAHQKSAASPHADAGALYAKRLAAIGDKHPHEGELAPAEKSLLAGATHDGVTLSARVDPARHTLVKAAFHGAKPGDQARLLEAFCRVLEGKPILEDSDHAVILLEFELRDPAMSRPVAGIVTPENAHPMFALPTRLIRDLMADYRRQSGFKSITNYHDQPISAAWKALSPEERTARLAAALAKHPAGRGVQLVRLESTQRVVVHFEEECSSGEKQHRLMQIEDYLQSELEPTLQMYVEQKMDINKPRQTREPNLR